MTVFDSKGQPIALEHFTKAAWATHLETLTDVERVGFLRGAVQPGTDVEVIDDTILPLNTDLDELDEEITHVVWYK